MQVDVLLKIINAEFYAGVPDSRLKALCDYLIDKYGTNSKQHIIAANEGNATALAAGYHLATGKVPVVYAQNSGEGNIINPAVSLLSDRVYGIPVVFIIGWRGEPGTFDEPQHIHQGAVTLKLLEDMDICSFVVGQDTTGAEIQAAMENFRVLLEAGKSVAFVIREGALSYDTPVVYQNSHIMSREEAIQHIVRATGIDPIVATTGKASRELFEIREQNGQGHQCDFLTVGSMGHASSIALGLALHRPERKIWCIDGDGAALMHMGAMAVIGSRKPSNFVHIIINNGAHESVGGMPTVADKIDFPAIAKACGYPYTVRVDTVEALDHESRVLAEYKKLSFIEVVCAVGARSNLGRPTITPSENKRAFQTRIKS